MKSWVRWDPWPSNKSMLYEPFREIIVNLSKCLRQTRPSPSFEKPVGDLVKRGVAVDVFHPVGQYERLINRDPRLPNREPRWVNRRPITIRAPQWAPIRQSHNIGRSGLKELKPPYILNISSTLTFFTSLELHCLCRSTVLQQLRLSISLTLIFSLRFSSPVYAAPCSIA
jgi:hypothetical protein